MNKNTDARKLSRETQEELRRRAVAAVQAGATKVHVAEVMGVSRYSVQLWVQAWEKFGEEGLKNRPKGPKKGYGRKLKPGQEKQIREWVVGKHPEQLQLPFYLWTRQAVLELIEDRFGVEVGLTTVGKYLKQWGFTPQKPVKRAFEQNRVAVQRWLDESYPEIAKRAKKEKALIYWGDETGLRSDYQAGRSYGLKGKTPVIPGTGQRFSINMISAITNRGHLNFMTFEGSFCVKTFKVFLRRLIKQAHRKVFLILDGHPVHRAKLIQKWRKEHQEEMEIFYLPGYSPELNPDELWNNDLKTNALGRRRPGNKDELKANVLSYSRSTQRRPDIVRNYFREKHVRYAA